MEQQKQQLLLQQQEVQQQQQQQQHQQQFLLLQQLTKQAQQQQQAAISRFPSNIDAHLRPPSNHRPLTFHQQNPNPNSNPIPNLQQQQGSNLGQNAQHLQQQQKGIRPQVIQVELQMAYQDAWRVCHPDFKGPFSSLEDACERFFKFPPSLPLFYVIQFCFSMFVMHVGISFFVLFL